MVLPPLLLLLLLLRQRPIRNSRRTIRDIHLFLLLRQLARHVIIHIPSCAIPCTPPGILQIVLIVLGSPTVPARTRSSVRAPELIRQEQMEKHRRETRAAHNIDKIMMRQVHRRPIQQPRVRPNELGRMGKEVAEEQRGDGRVCRVEGWERAEHDGGAGEPDGVS